MTSRLILMRHAKSDWADAGLADFDRPLAPRGRKAAPKMAHLLAKRKLAPDRIVASPALRALETARLVAAELDRPETVIVREPRIYEASLRTLCEVVSEQAPAGQTTLLVGHNPGFDALLCHLSAAEPEPDGSGKLMTTAAVAVLEFAAGIDVSGGTGSLELLVRPRDL